MALPAWHLLVAVTQVESHHSHRQTRAEESLHSRTDSTKKSLDIVWNKKKKVFYTAPFLVTLFLPSWQVHWYRPRLLHLQSCALSAQLVRCLSGTMWWKQVSVKMWAQQSLIQAWVWHRLFHLERFRPTFSAWSKSCSFLSSADEYISVIKWTATKQKLNNIRRSWQHHQGCGDMYNSLFSNPVGHISEGTRVEID